MIGSLDVRRTDAFSSVSICTFVLAKQVNLVVKVQVIGSLDVRRTDAFSDVSICTFVLAKQVN